MRFLRCENRDEQDSRIIEITACGSFMLAERTAAHNRLFIENMEAVYFDTNEELLKKFIIVRQILLKGNKFHPMVVPRV